MTTRKATKRALLMSFLSILLCASMLIGTTYAWFTDSVTSAGNIIKSGTLDVTMEWKDATATGAQQSYKDASAGAMFNYDKWEPGYVEAKNIKIANVGTLALKYQLNILATGTVSELADVIDVYFADEELTLANRDMTGMTLLGTLREFIDGMPAKANGQLAAKTGRTVTIALKMQETAGNEYQDLAIGSQFAVQLLATQLTSEFDSFDNQYDKDAIYYDTLVTNAEEMYAAVAAAPKDTVIAIDGNIVLTKALSRSDLSTIKFVGANDSASLDQATFNMYFNDAKVTFEGLTLTHGEKAYGNGGQTSTAFAVWNAKEVNYVDCTFNRSVGTIHAPLHNFIGCTFNGVENPNNTKSEYPLYICDGQDYNVVDCVFNCTNRGAILFYNDGGTGVDTLNISNTKFLGDIIADKTAVEIHNNSNVQVYNVNIKDVVVGNGIINGLYRIKPANVGEVNVTVDGVLTNVTFISSADELVNAFANLKAGDTLYLTSDIDMTGKTVAPVTGNKGFTMLGNGHTISNLNGNSAALFVAHSGSSSYTFDSVVLENCAVDSATNYGALFVGDGDTSDAITIKNCVVKNCTVKSAKYAAAFVGYTAGYNVVNNGPVYSDVLIENCSVIGGSITGGGSTGAAIGHAGGNVDTTSTVTGLKVDGVAINGEDADHTGIVVGTANVGDTVINGTVYTGVTGNYNTATVLYGRFVPGTTGTLTIDGVAK